MPIQRKVVGLGSSSRQNTIPSAVRLGPMFFSSSIEGRDPKTGNLPKGTEQQFEVAFENMKSLMSNAGLALDHLAHVTVFIRDGSYRKFINQPWLRVFPNDEKRPARKTTAYDLPPGVFVHLQSFGVEGAGRQALEIPGLAHRDPLPMGVKIGNLVFSSVIGGQDPKTGKQVEGVIPQYEQAFENMKSLVEQAGGSIDNIGHVWVFLRDREDQPDMVKTWVKMFPKDGDRPSRKTIMYDELKGRETRIQMQFTALLGERRKNFEIPGVGHHDPIPMGTSLGNLFFSSGIGGYDQKTGKRAVTLEDQTNLSFENLKTLMAEAGRSVTDVGHLTILVKDYGSQPTILKKYSELYPNPDQRPAVHFMKLGLPGDNLVQLHATGVF